MVHGIKQQSWQNLGHGKGVLVLPTVIAGLNDYALAVTFHQEI